VAQLYRRDVQHKDSGQQIAYRAKTGRTQNRPEIVGWSRAESHADRRFRHD